jgi:GNAT superfamily N-acetyltransferase
MPEVKIAVGFEDLRRCYPVMRQLRPHLSEQQFVEQAVRQNQRYGYTVAFIEDGGQVVAVAGFRVSECLCDGNFMYVDDLVTDEHHRSRGHGDRLFDWLVGRAAEEGCQEIGLESGVQRFEAHRFYLRKRMRISSHHFSLPLRHRP